MKRKTVSQKRLKHKKLRTCRSCENYKEVYWTDNPNPKLSGLCGKCSDNLYYDINTIYKIWSMYDEEKTRRAASTR